MRYLLLLSTLLFCFSANGDSWRLISKVEELPVDATETLEISRPKVRLCGGESEESSDCVLCTVCHPHEYELIGCSEQMDSVCANCTSGWKKETPRTPDFFYKCTKHPLLPLLFPDIPYPVTLDASPSSMFADQEIMLQNAENEMFETDDMDLSDETEDYDGEEDQEEDEDEEIEKKEDDDDDGFPDLGLPNLPTVDIDEYELKRGYEKVFKQMAVFRRRVQDNRRALGQINLEETEEESHDEKRSDQPDKEKDEEMINKDDADSEEEHIDADDKDISNEEIKMISDAKRAWQVLRDLQRMKDIEEEPDYIDTPQNELRMRSDYRPMPVQVYDYETKEAIIHFPKSCPGWIMCISICLIIFYIAIKICVVKRGNRFASLPELDDISRQMINEAHARIHGKKYEMPTPEYV